MPRGFNARLRAGRAIGAAPRAASGELPVHNYGGQAANAVLFRPARDVVLLHLMDLDFVIGARKLF